MVDESRLSKWGRSGRARGMNLPVALDVLVNQAASPKSESRNTPPVVGSAQSQRPLMFAYWGRRGAVSQLTFLLAAFASKNNVPCTFSISQSNELFDQFSTAAD